LIHDFIKEKSDFFNKYLFDNISLEKYGKTGVAAMYSLEAGGKRFRPVLSLSVAEMLEIDTKKILPFATAIELIHTYSLIHDDLPSMDDDDFRRGKPSNHKVFGEAAAILAGDGLLTLAFEFLTKKTKHIDAETVLKGIEIISGAAGINGMIYGQCLDMECEGKNISLSELQKIHKNKTGALIKAATIIPAVVNKLDKETLNIFSDFSDHLGFLFQISDDILDVTSSTEVLGKPVLSDVAHNKITYVSLLGLEEAKNSLNYEEKKCLGTLALLPYNTKNLEQLVKFVAGRRS